MRTKPHTMGTLLATGMLMTTLLTGCDRPPPLTDPTPPVTTAAPTVAEPAPTATPTPPPAAVDEPDISAVQPPVEPAPPPTTRAEGPAVATMSTARAVSKLGVPVTLHYQFSGEVVNGQPVTLHLAAVPRVAGSNLALSIKHVAGLSTTESTLRAQKATATSTYRQQVTVTRQADGPQDLRVLVTMDLPEGSAFSYYSVPFGAAPAAQKQQSEKQQ